MIRPTHNMWKLIAERIESIFDACRVPDGFLLGLFGILLIGLLLLTLTRSIKRWVSYVSLLIAVEYGVLVFCCTVIFRYTEEKEVHLMPLWSYYCILIGKGGFVHDVLLNVLIFIPFGILLGVYYGIGAWIKISLFAFLFSLCIEMAQYLFNKGVPETDDIIHNTIGCACGYLLYTKFRRLLSIKGTYE